jgi:mandelate racemase
MPPIPPRPQPPDMIAPVLTVDMIRAVGVEVPLAQPAITAAGTFTAFPIVLIDLRTVEGIVGRVYVFAYERLAVRPLIMLIEELGGLIKGHKLYPLAIATVLQRRMRLLGAEGLVAMALGGIDMAVWDAVARAADMPLGAYLGGAPRPIPAYRTLKSMTPDGAASDAVAAVRQGFSGVKAKLGGATVADDVAVVQAVRGEVGDRVAIIADYNQVLSVTEAIARCRVLDDHGLVWIEEPTRAQDYAGHARIASEARTPISIGENWNGLADAAKSIVAGAADFIMPDAARIGGVTGWMHTAGLAAAHDIPLSGHALPELSLHLLTATPTAHWLEYADLVETILREPMQIRDGCAVMPARPGFGIEWDAAALKRLTG